MGLGDLLGSLLSLALQVLHGSSLLAAQLAQPGLLCLQLCQHTSYLHPHTHTVTPPISRTNEFCMCNFQNKEILHVQLKCCMYQ